MTTTLNETRRREKTHFVKWVRLRSLTSFQYMSNLSRKRSKSKKHTFFSSLSLPLCLSLSTSLSPCLFFLLTSCNPLARSIAFTRSFCSWPDARLEQHRYKFQIKFRRVDKIAKQYQLKFHASYLVCCTKFQIGRFLCGRQWQWTIVHLMDLSNCFSIFEFPIIRFK